MSVKTLNKDDMSACLPHLFAALEDRTAEVRKAAQEATLPFMIHLGYETLARNAGKLKPVSKTLVQAQLDKVRPLLPAKPVPAPAAAAASASASSTAVRGRASVVQAPKDTVRDEEDAAAKANGVVKGLRPPSKSKVSGCLSSVVGLLSNLMGFFFFIEFSSLFVV